MQPIRKTTSAGGGGTATGETIVLNWRNDSPFNVSLICTIKSGSPTYTVQYTGDDVFAASFTPAGAAWINHPSLTGDTTNQDSNLSFPVTAVRLNITAGANSSVEFAVLQAG